MSQELVTTNPVLTPIEKVPAPAAVIKPKRKAPIKPGTPVEAPEIIMRSNPHATEEYYQKMSKLVRGVFKFDEAPGQTLSFNFRKFFKDPIRKYSLEDGKVYTIPLAVAQHINKNMAYPIHKHIQDDTGVTSVRIGRMVHRASFQSLEFSDIEEYPVDLVTVERV